MSSGRGHPCSKVDSDMVADRMKFAVLTLAVTLACSSDPPSEQGMTFADSVGVNTHYASGGDVDHDALTRLAEAGVYDFVGSGFDELVETCESLGLRILFIPECYVELVRSTAPALRAADPDGEVVVGALFFGLPEITEAAGLGIGGPRFLESVAATGALAFADEVSLHLYRLDRPEGTAAELQAARNLLDDAGYPLPIWSGEWGYSTYDPSAPPDGFNFIPAVTPNRQASYLARMLLYSYGLGLRRSIIVKDRDARNANPCNIEHHWGLMEGDLTRKPSYFALSTLTELLGDAGPPEILALGAGEHALRFELPIDSQVTALWAEQKATWSLRAEGPSGEAQVRGRDGTDLMPDGLSEECNGCSNRTTA